MINDFVNAGSKQSNLANKGSSKRRLTMVELIVLNHG